jgi:hypothetical protein
MPLVVSGAAWSFMACFVDRVDQGAPSLGTDLFTAILTHSQIQTRNHDQFYLLTHPLGKTKTQGVLASRVQLVLRVVQSNGLAFSLDISPRSSGSASGTHRDT